MVFLTCEDTVGKQTTVQRLQLQPGALVVSSSLGFPGSLLLPEPNDR